MAGIYIHIPFCRSRCAYCAFYSTTSLEMRQKYVDALVQEIKNEALKRRDENYAIGTIYLGGGTPSQLSIGQLRQLFDTLYIYNKVEDGAEVTIEVNPDDVTEAFAIELTTLPVNRVSMGAQTFDSERLKSLGRRHTADQVSQAVARLRAAGIGNMSIDLMYGLPGESLADWEHDIDTALALGVEHLSAYCLTLEEGTPLYRAAMRHTIDSPDEEAERAMYEVLIERLTAAGYEHYEISNFARKGFRSRHNSNYWNSTPYRGFGAAAHSYDIHTRSWNISDIRQYIEGMARGERIFESERLDEDTRYNDVVTVALRTREGLPLQGLSERHRNYCLKNARRFISDGLLQQEDGHLRLTRAGLFVSDMIMADLIWIQ